MVFFSIVAGILVIMYVSHGTARNISIKTSRSTDVAWRGNPQDIYLRDLIYASGKARSLNQSRAVEGRAVIYLSISTFVRGRRQPSVQRNKVSMRPKLQV